MIGEPRTSFDEKLAIDYKWFDAHNIVPRYEFGHGLSYTTFELTDLRVHPEHHKDETIHQTAEKHIGPLELYDTLYVARVEVRNTGERDGAEVPQLVSRWRTSLAREEDCHWRQAERWRRRSRASIAAVTKLTAVHDLPSLAASTTAPPSGLHQGVAQAGAAHNRRVPSRKLRYVNEANLSARRTLRCGMLSRRRGACPRARSCSRRVTALATWC